MNTRREEEEMTDEREVDQFGNCSRCGGIHYGTGLLCVFNEKSKYFTKQDKPEQAAIPETVVAPKPTSSAGQEHWVKCSDCRTTWDTERHGTTECPVCGKASPSTPVSGAQELTRVRAEIYANPTYLASLLMRIKTAYFEKEWKAVERLFEAEIEEMEKRRPTEAQEPAEEAWERALTAAANAFNAHIHVARHDYKGDEACAKCGKNFRDSVHLRAGETAIGRQDELLSRPYVAKSVGGEDAKK